MFIVAILLSLHKVYAMRQIDLKYHCQFRFLWCRWIHQIDLAFSAVCRLRGSF